MSVLYLLTSPPPIIDGTDAVFQEAAVLRDAFGGQTINLFPFKRPSRRLPREILGFHKVHELRNLERRCALNHVYYSVLYFFPVLRFLHNPTVYTIAASLRGHEKPSNVARLKALHRIVVSNDRDAHVLEEWGLANYSVIPPGIDRSGFASESLPLGSELTLLMASAPWVPQQFDLKGIDTLLEVTAKLPFLKLILLWRGLLFGELAERVARLEIEDRVEIVNSKVRISDYLKRAHASVLLAKRGDIIKSYPHSLIESLIAGKPVLVSDSIPMADYVRGHQCGIVLNDVSVSSLAAAVEMLKSHYETLARNAAQIRPTAFSIGTMVESYRRVYGV